MLYQQLSVISYICDKDMVYMILINSYLYLIKVARCSFVVKVFAHGAMGRWIDPSWLTH